MLTMFKRKPKEITTVYGTGVNLDFPETVTTLEAADSVRKSHCWTFGTTRVGKTRKMQNIVEQDIRKGYSVVVIDPKSDLELFSSITHATFETGREEDLMLVTPIFPKNSAIIDPLASYYLPEELVAHITSGVPVGRDPFFYSIAYEVSLIIVQSLLLLSEVKGVKPQFNLSDVKNMVGYNELKELKDRLQYIDTKMANQLVLDLNKVLATPQDYFSKVASSLRTSLMELTTGNVGQIIGNADENRFLKRLESGKTVIMVVQLGALLTKQAAYTTGKVIISMIQSLVGRVLATGAVLNPPLALHIDEASSLLYNGIEELWAKGGGANLYIHGYAQSVSQLYDTVGENKAHVILDNCNTKFYMRVPDEKTAHYVVEHLGLAKRFSPIMSLGGGLTIREAEEPRVKHTEIMNMQSQEFFLQTYSGIYRGRTAMVPECPLTIRYPEINTKQKY
jgi:hypothetical protein